MYYFTLCVLIYNSVVFSQCLAVPFLLKLHSGEWFLQARLQFWWSVLQCLPLILLFFYSILWWPESGVFIYYMGPINAISLISPLIVGVRH